MTQTAVRLHGPADLRVETLPHPGPPARGEVLLRVTATGVCGSDLHPYETGSIGSTILGSPLILGHEFAGVIEEVGEGVDAALLGARVAVDPSQPCGVCFHCAGGDPNLCRNQKFAGLWPHDGSLCQWMRVPAKNCFPVPDSVTNEEAALLEPLGIALHATDLARIRVGSTVAIIGAGPIGLCLAQTARLAGAETVYITDRIPGRVAAAAKLGAQPLPNGLEADVTIEAAWANESVQQAMDVTRGGGTVVLVGIPLEDSVSFRHSVARRKGLTILMSRRMKHTYPRALALVQNGRVHLKSLVTHRFPLNQVPEAFRMNAAYEDNVVKTIIENEKNSMSNQYVIGLDYGTNSVRALVVDVRNGAEIGTAVWNYEHGTQGVLLSRDPNLARQNPADYLKGAEATVKAALGQASAAVPGFEAAQVIGLGVDTTGSTPIPVDRAGNPIAAGFEGNLNALAWLWKDHTGVAEASEITALAAQIRPQYLAKCGGTYSSEWFWSKVLHCLRVDPAVFDAAYLWVECADWIPAVLTGTQAPETLTVGVCAAGHKAMFNAEWGGYPDAEFLTQLDPKLAELRGRLKSEAHSIDKPVGGLCAEWAAKLGLPEDTPVAVGAFDAHLGGVGAGIAPGILVKTIGTSTCDLMVVPATEPLADIPGLCGIVNGSILPGDYGLEAGQSAVGDIFNWFVEYLKAGTHEELTVAAGALQPGESGLLALDWNNGNRTVLVDQRLAGLLLGQTLYTTPGEIYRALIEATAFGTLTIINRLEEYGVPVEQVINCGGIAEKNGVVMQIYADVTGRPMKVSRSAQTCALGAAIAGAVSAGRYATYAEAQRAMTGLKDIKYLPNAKAHAVYQQLYSLYRDVHDAFGTTEWSGNLFHVMKTLLDIRDAARK